MISMKLSKLKVQLEDYWELTKPGVTFMVIISTLGGFYLGSGTSMNIILLIETVIATWMVAGGTNAFNQLIEYKLDAKMKRTQNRPLPAGRLTPANVRLFAITISILGISWLALRVNPLTALLAALTLSSYVFIYTPLKRKTHLSTLIGAVPGALPAMGGWAAVRGEISIEAWTLFAILFFWQLPHFMAIAWIYRDDYTRGGFPVLPAIDKDGYSTGLHIVSNCLALLSVSLLPTVFGLTGAIYFVGAFVIGIIFLVYGVQTALRRTNAHAKRLLHVSIIYLPILFALMFIDKVGL